MLDGIFKLLKLEVALAIAIIGLLLKTGIWVAKLLTRLVPNKAHSPAASQPEIHAPQSQDIKKPLPVPTPVPARAAPPAAVTNTETDTPQLSSGGRVHSKIRAILNTVDHGIWVAGMDDFITPHPRAEELLDMLDRMMLVAAHRNGEPFTVASLDNSEMAYEGLPELQIDDGFDDVPIRAIPHEDGKIWRLEAEGIFERMPPSRRRVSPPMAPTSVVEAPEPLLAEDEIFLEGRAVSLPAPDGYLWTVELGHNLRRLPLPQAHPLPRPVTS